MFPDPEDPGSVLQKDGSVMDSDLRSKCSWKVLAQESQSNFARKTSKELLRWIPFVKFPPKAYHQLVHLPDHLQNTPQTPSVHSCRVDPPPQPLRCAAARWAIPFLVILLSLLAPLPVPYGTCQVIQVIQVITARWCGGTWLESCQSCSGKHTVLVRFCQQTDCYNIIQHPDISWPWNGFSRFQMLTNGDIFSKSGWMNFCIKPKGKKVHHADLFLMRTGWVSGCFSMLTPGSSSSSIIKH